MTVTPRRLPRERRREAILRVAGELLTERPYDAVSMSDTVRAAGVSRPVVYDHFPSKRALLLGLIETHHTTLMDAIGATPGVRVTDEAAFRVLLDAVLAHFERDPAGWRLLCQEPSIDPEVAAIQRRGRDEIHEAVQRVLPLEGSQTERRIAAEAVRAAVNGLFEWQQEQPQLGRAQLVDAAVAVLWRGVGSTAAGPAPAV